MRSSAIINRIAGYVLLGLLTLLLIATAIYSLNWRTGYDPAWLMYDARLIDQHHLVPYRDFHEINLPGSLYLYLLIGKAIGYTNESLLRIIDLGCLGAISLATWIWLRPMGHKVAWGAAVLFGVGYLTSDITVNIQRDYFIILPLACSAALSIRFPHWSPMVRSLLIGILGGLVATIKPHALIGWPVLFGFIYHDVQRTQPRRLPIQALRIGLPALLGLSLPVAIMIVYLVNSGSWSDFIELETKYVPLYSHVARDLVIIDYPERLGYLLTSYIGFDGLGWWFIPAGIGIASTLHVAPPGSRQRQQVFQMIGLAVCYSLYPAVSGQFFNYHWLPFLYILMALSALSLNDLPRSLPLVLNWVPLIALIGCLVLPPSQILDTLDRLEKHYIQGQPIPPTDGGMADELAAYLQMHHQPEDRVQVLGSSGAPLHGLLLADALPATYFLLDLPLYHDLSHPLNQKYRQLFMSQMEQSPPRSVIDIHHRAYFFGPDSSREFPEFSRLLTENYGLAYVGKILTIYEHQPDLRRGFVVYPLKDTDIPIRYHLEAAADVVPLNHEQVLDAQIVDDKLSDFIDNYDIVEAEFLAEQDPARAIESRIGQHAFRIGEHWISATRIVEYLVAPPECTDMQASGVTFGSSIHLDQYAASLVRKGETQWICVRLDWSSTQPLSNSYKLSVRVMDQGEQAVALYDSRPAGYLAPTTSWKPGETIRDQLALPLPAALTTGHYRVELVLYDEATMEHLPLEGAPSGDALLLMSVQIQD
ncbi:MAG: hypothetical protein JXB30_00915 [Anaerolineae bacterium]|nr:hypothetical protein [Anaerolineae bacterium]